MVDVIIVGAGLSGIGAASQLVRKHPEKSFLILESRENIGGTWDLFRYPGIRSDSNMYTFGYSFKPWKKNNSFASGNEILNYLKEMVDQYQLLNKIKFSIKVVKAKFDSKANLWTLKTKNNINGEQKVYQTKLFFSCTGYYSYTDAYTPDFKNMSSFKGEIVHPQHWKKDLNYEQKDVIIIGSGATAVTLLPKMAQKTKSLTMLQRSPSYIGVFPNIDKFAVFLKKILPAKWAYRLLRFKNISLDVLFYIACMKWPEKVKKFILDKVKKGIGDMPMDPNFIPNYFPWEQRFCLAPDGDFYKTIKEKKASLITDHIDCFTENGILLKSGKELKADIIVTATGLNLLAFGGMDLYVDDRKVILSEKYIYKGIMLNEVPNMITFIGYTNASWTLKSDLTSEFASRLIRKMDKESKNRFFVSLQEDSLEDIPLLNLNSGYILRSQSIFPKQKNKVPWKLNQNYFLDFIELRIKPLENKFFKIQ